MNELTAPTILCPTCGVIIRPGNGRIQYVQCRKCRTAIIVVKAAPNDSGKTAVPFIDEIAFDWD